MAAGAWPDPRGWLRTGIHRLHGPPTVKGSPIATYSSLSSIEDPLSSCAVAGGRARCWAERELPLKAYQTVTTVPLLAPPPLTTSPRRCTMERERAHPYRTFCINSWYDSGYFSKYDEVGA